MENEEKVQEEINQEKATLQYQCPALPQINMENPLENKTYQLVLLQMGTDLLITTSYPSII